jgi:hypothetical protein
MLTVMVVGVKQQPFPDGEMLIQFPPLPVAAMGVKRRLPLVLAIVMVLGGGFTPRVVLKVSVGS